MRDFEELTDEAGWRAAWPVMRELRPHLEEDGFVDLVRQMRPAGYRLVALRDAGGIVAVAGFAVLLNLYDLRHLWVYDLVTRADHRSRGHGQRLLEHLEECGRRDGCGRIVLSSGLQRRDAHRFYEQRMGYDRASYVYRKTL